MLSENKALTKRGLEYARSDAVILEKKEVGRISKEGSQFYFNINEEKLRIMHNELGISMEVCTIEYPFS